MGRQCSSLQCIIVAADVALGLFAVAAASAATPAATAAPAAAAVTAVAAAT